MNILSVDWDFFFPNPLESDNPGQNWELYDWGHSENELFINIIWPIRAETFLRNNIELPGLSGEQIRFWERFKFSKGTECYVAESHSFIANMLNDGMLKRGDRVVSFDAHHDCGYKGDLASIIREGKVYCDNWGVFFLNEGVGVSVVYPRWKGNFRKVEKRCLATPGKRTTDDGRKWATTFDAVFVCRSGAWVPPWLDDSFAEFIERCPVPVYGEQSIPKRSWCLTEVLEAMVAKDEMFKQAQRPMQFLHPE